jgi:alkanesulfonate monooxygenase SsuD/methylene tetrahydromethanopterin reductase-like flavin-dependent oxidoreductase (luciferase family)
VKFAHFAHVWGKSGMTPHQRYEQLWRELRLCDELGFHSAFCVEHHFRPDESWMSCPQLYAVAAGMQTKRLRPGAMGHIVPLHHPVRLVEEIAIADQMLGGRLEVGLVSGITRSAFGPFGVDFASRRDVLLEFVHFLKAAYGDTRSFDFNGRFIRQEKLTLAVKPAQRPHPPLWIESRDPATLEFCAREGINTGYFFFFSRAQAFSRYGKFLEDWKQAGWPDPPRIAYCALVHVDTTDDRAMATAYPQIGRAYRGFFPPAGSDEELHALQEEHARVFEGRGEHDAAEIVRNLLDPDWLVEQDLVLVGSPRTVAEKLRRWATEGRFNTFFGEFNFGELAEDDLLRSIRLFGEEVMPDLGGWEPF